MAPPPFLGVSPYINWPTMLPTLFIQLSISGAYIQYSPVIPDPSFQKVSDPNLVPDLNPILKDSTIMNRS
jgi:hypothetical protein